MGVVAGSTVHHPRIDIEVILGKRGPFQVVAPPAQRLNRLVDQSELR